MPDGVPGATIALVAIFLPGLLLVLAALPFWDSLRTSVGIRRALTGTNAAVVGILLAALYTPVWTSAITAPVDVVVAAGALALLADRTRPAHRRRRPVRTRRTGSWIGLTYGRSPAANVAIRSV